MQISSAPPSSASSCTVLLIEDDPEQLAFWSSALRNCSSHYAVLEAASGQDGLEMLRHQSVDCVVLDLDLSATSGFEFLLKLVPNRDRPKIAVVILTRLRNPTLAQASLQNGAQAYLVKQQSSPEALDKAIQKAVTSVASILGKPAKSCG
jgi:CheY-like chemotaxis protein